MATATKAPMPSFTGKYAQIRKDFYKGLVLAKYDPARTEYKTEAGFRKALMGKFSAGMKKLDAIENAGTVLNARATIKWTSGGNYGRQAACVLSYTYMTPDGKVSSKVIEGKRTGGWGYDKASTAFETAADESLEFMKLLLDARAKKKDVGYGASLNIGEPYMPHYNYGVGMGSICTTMGKLGYKVNHVPTYSEDVEVYTFDIKRKPAVRRS